MWGFATSLLQAEGHGDGRNMLGFGARVRKGLARGQSEYRVPSGFASDGSRRCENLAGCLSSCNLQDPERLDYGSCFPTNIIDKKLKGKGWS